MSGSYTVIDVETTGFSAATDRIIEIALVHVTAAGIIDREWSTLVNPGCDVGPTHVHGIRNADVAQAPTFAQIAPWILEQIRGTVLVAHFSPFDLGFLAAEFKRVGVELDDSALPQVDTRLEVPQIVGVTSHKLVDCCRALGVELTNAHTALGDTRATAQLLVHCLRAAQADPERARQWQERLEAAENYPWPAPPPVVPVEPRTLARPQGSGEEQDLDAWKDGLVEAMRTLIEQIHATDVEQQYLAALVESLADRTITTDETAVIETMARRAGMAEGEQKRLNRLFVGALATAAVRDGVVTPAEVGVIEQVASILGFGSAKALQALDFAASRLGGSAAGGAHARGEGVGTSFDETDATAPWANPAAPAEPDSPASSDGPAED